MPRASNPKVGVPDVDVSSVLVPKTENFNQRRLSSPRESLRFTCIPPSGRSNSQFDTIEAVAVIGTGANESQSLSQYKRLEIFSVTPFLSTPQTALLIK